MKYIYLLVIVLSSTITTNAQKFENFVTADGYKLMDGDKQLRFISWNIPNLNYVEDEMAFDNSNPYDLPTEYEIRDAFETVQRMGGQVIRIYTIPVKNKNFPKDAPTYVEGPGQFNEEAFKVNDLMLALAHEYQVRIIFSLLNNWQWMGGRPNYADFRGKTADEFWTDKQLIEDFKQTIDFTLNRTNTITGVKYKDDKSILCWETGNELASPYSWTKEIAAYIKKIDKNHLLMDGYLAIDNRPILETSINDKNIDIISSHHYERSPLEMLKNINMNIDILQKRKPYMIGEFGFESTAGIESVIDKIIASPEICGGLTWSLRYHHRNGGFYHHSEPMGSGIYKSYHYPGFNSGEKYDERSFLTMYRRKAFEIQNVEVPVDPKPLTPKLLDIKECYDIRWQGSAGAEGYNVYRAQSKDGPWKLVGYNVSDADIQVFANFHDETAELSKEYFYAVEALNQGGVSGRSNIIGPVIFNRKAKVDNLSNFGKIYDMHNVKPVTGEDRTYKEISTRMAGDYGAEMIYYNPGILDEFKLYSFEGSDHWHFLNLFVSEDGEHWEHANPEVGVYASGETNYNYGVPKIYTIQNQTKAKYVKIFFKMPVQIARVELLYK